MKRALVVKPLTGRILLVRTDEGDLLSLSVPCTELKPGTMLHLLDEGNGCVIAQISGSDCAEDCQRDIKAVVIEHKDYAPQTVSLETKRAKRRVV